MQCSSSMMQVPALRQAPVGSFRTRRGVRVALLCRALAPAPAARSSTAAGPQPAAAAAQPAAAWRSFTQRFSGEWEGATATFDAQGEPQPLDPHYVPQAYRDWGVELHDWQTTCSSLALSDQPPGTIQTLVRPRAHASTSLQRRLP